MHKKGIFGSLLVDPWFIIVFIFVLMIFYILFTTTVSKTSMEVKGELAGLENNLAFISFLRAPVDENMNDLDLFYFYSKDKKDESAKKILENARFFLIGDYCIEISLENEELEGKYFNDCGGEYFGSEIDSFGFKNFENKQVRIVLFKGMEENICSFINSNELCENWFNCKLNSFGGCEKQ